MKYHYRKGTFERDVMFILMLYIMVGALFFAGYCAFRTYMAEGRLANGVCEVKR